MDIFIISRPTSPYIVFKEGFSVIAATHLTQEDRQAELLLSIRQNYKNVFFH